MRHVLRTLFAVIVASVVLAGCKSQPEAVEETSAGSTPVAQPTTPSLPWPGEPVMPPPTDAEDNPLDSTTGLLLDHTFHFDFDQARLSESDLRLLATHAAHLRDLRNRSVIIEGHCDERGTREYNLALGERRAQAVALYLTSAGVHAVQIETVSYGEERPEDPGHDESAWAKNRRAMMIYR